MNTTIPGTAPTLDDLASMQRVAHVSSEQPGKDVWTELGIYYQPNRTRPFVGAVIGAVAPNHPRGYVPRIRWAAFGTLERACSWFEPSDLRDRLLAEVPDDARILYPNSNEIAQAAAAERREGMLDWKEAVDTAQDRERASRQGDCIGGVELSLMTPASMRVVGFYDGTLGGVLRWLYPETKTDAGLSLSMERDFDIPARTVRRALAIEADTVGNVPGQLPAGMGAWVGMFLQAMRCFDRELWAAGQATVATVGR